MIITRTPFRISFFGGGTDFPQWYEENGGAVLSTTINKYCYITCRELEIIDKYKYRIVYAIMENSQEIGSIKHPVVRATLMTLKEKAGLEIHHDGDLPARSGLGTSSAFAVGLILALKTLRKQEVLRKELANIAINIEQKILMENVGCQDQIAVSHGGFNRIEFRKNGDYVVKPLIININKKNELNERLLLINTGITRYSSEIQKSQLKKMATNKRILTKMYELVTTGEEILTKEDRHIDEFGHLMHETWSLKKRLSSEISSSGIDDMYNAARAAGALGGKLLGAGAGGFMLLYADPKFHKKIRHQLGLQGVSFKFDELGAQVIYQDNVN